jgi:hypothetical protein
VNASVRPRPYELFSYRIATRRRPSFAANRASWRPLAESLEMTRKVHGEMPVRSGEVAVVATAGSRPS